MKTHSKMRTLNSLTIATAMALVLPAAIAPTASAQVRHGIYSSERPQYVTGGQRYYQPQNFLESLFPGLIEQRIQRERAFRPPVQVQAVSAPKYYDYAPQKLVKIDLSSLVPDVTGVAQPSPSAEPASFEGRSDRDIVTGTVDVADPGGTVYERIAQRFEGLSVMAEPEIGKALVQHYKTTGKLMWLDDEFAPNAKARSVLPVLQDAASYGLNPADYDVGLPSDVTATNLEEAARFEIAMTARVIRYGMDAYAGRINPNKLSGYHDFPEGRISAETVLKKLGAGGLPARALIGFNPDSPQFEALRAELGNIKHETGDLIVIPGNILIRPGQTHEQVPNVLAAIARRGSPDLSAKAKTLLEGDEPLTTLTPEAVELVRAFQTEQQLGADGVVGPNTIARLSDVDPATKRDQIIFAMERLRWLPHSLGSRHVFINQPAYTVRYVDGGKTQLEMRVVVGKPSNQTSFFYDEIETVEYNPYWGIPRSILVNEYLPKLRENPAYLDERGYEVTDRRGRRIPSSAIDWYAVGSDFEFDVRQKPGDGNALGELKILFPNKHAIYMHDTPARNLFERSARAFSHGCVRLQYPRQMAAAVLGKSVDYVASRIAGGEHSSDPVPGNIPVYVAYFTAWPDDAGKVAYFADMYNRDARLGKAFDATHAARSVTS